HSSSSSPPPSTISTTYRSLSPSSSSTESPTISDDRDEIQSTYAPSFSSSSLPPSTTTEESTSEETTERSTTTMKTTTIESAPNDREKPLNNTSEAHEDEKNGSLFGAVPAPSSIPPFPSLHSLPSVPHPSPSSSSQSYISSPDSPFSANEEFWSSHVAQKMKAGPNTGNYDTSMGMSGSELEEKKAQLVARDQRRKTDEAVQTPPHEIRENSQPLRRVESDRRPIQASSRQFSIDSTPESLPSPLTPIIPVSVSSPLSRLPTDHPTRSHQWSPPVWESFPAPHKATIFRVGEKKVKREAENGRKKRKDEITVDVHADEILVLTTEEMALQKAQSEANAVESRNLRQVSHETRPREEPVRHNVTLAHLLNSPIDLKEENCVKNVVVPIVAIFILATILQVLTCSALFSQRKRHSVQMKQLMTVHYT
ncbi:hypothetical protein PFISCL1PPCAC_5851, partial [Pristionchus fissidentatus]